MPILNIANGQGTAPQVPFWLQILSIALAPFLGFIGVAIGILLNERNRKQAYVTEERRKVYQDFLKVFSDFTVFLSTEYLSAMEDLAALENLKLARLRLKSNALESNLNDSESKLDNIESHYNKLQSLLEHLMRVYSHIGLIGSPRAARAAAYAFQYGAQAGTLTFKVMDEGQFNRSDWEGLIGKAWDIRERFTEVARKDLGLQRREGPMPKPNSSPDPNESQKLFRQTIDSLSKSKADQTQDPNN